MDKEIVKHGLWSWWEAETAHQSTKSSWHKWNRSIWQCAITSLLIKDILWWDIIKADVDNYGFSHYRNAIDGEEIDFTYDQFDAPPMFSNKTMADSDSMLKNEDTYKRYERLKLNFSSFIKKYESIEKNVLNCKSCENVDHFDHNSIHLGKNCSLLFIGEAPAKNGWKVTWKAWLNEKGNIIPSGKILQKLLDIPWIDLFDVTFTEAVKCLPSERKHIKTAAKNCNYILYSQVDLLKPNILITLWDHPTRALLWDTYKNFWEVVGKEFTITIHNKEYTIIPIYHPSPVSPKSLQWNIPIFNTIKDKLITRDSK